MTRKIIRRSAAVLTAVLFALPVCAADYRDQFTDVAKTAWYYNDVADAYANGLISGKSDTEFKPDGTLTVAEAVKLAVVCHQTLVSGKVSPLSPSGENWYDPYVTYAKDNGIVTEDEDYTAPATRGKIAVLFSRAMISSGTDCPEVNPIAFGNLSDVDVSAWYSGAVYRLYRWGILTGDGTSVKPESPVKRSEISAVVMRMIDASRRVDLDKTNGEKLPQAPTVTPPADNTGASSGTGSGSTSAPDVMSSLTLYAGSTDKKAFTGITAAAGDFAVTDGVSYQNASYSMDLLNSVILENDNISFRLYTGSGYEALGIVRGWLNEAARGCNGAVLNERNDVYAAVNSLFKIWIDDERIPINEMWYADHGDYTTYAFYFDRYLKPEEAESVRFLCGRLDVSTLEAYGLQSLSYLVDNAEELTTPPVEESLGNLGGSSDVTPGESDSFGDTAAYDSAMKEAKNGAEILYEYNTSRCTILYGRRLYGSTADDYRLLFIFPDGTVQNVAYVKLDSIRINNEGDVLYYAIDGPDGRIIQYGVNFGQ